MSHQDYFTRTNLRQKARSMLSEVEGFRKRHAQKLDPKRSALLVIDMQRYFLDESSGAFIAASGAIVPAIARLVDRFFEAGSPIVFTRHLNTDADAGMMSPWWHGDLIRPDDPLSEISLYFDTSKGVVLQKSQYDAFYRTGLEVMLRQKGVSQIVVCGVMTNLCCETTARSGFVRGFEVFFAIDGTATHDEGFHRATLLNLAYGFAVPVTMEEITLSFSEGTEGSRDSRKKANSTPSPPLVGGTFKSGGHPQAPGRRNPSPLFQQPDKARFKGSIERNRDSSLLHG